MSRGQGSQPPQRPLDAGSVVGHSCPLSASAVTIGFAPELHLTICLKAIDTFRRWPLLRSVAMVRSERTVAGVTSVETRQYISSLPSGAERVAYAIRNHWGIENQVHWILDVVFAADDSRARIGHSAHNLAIIRHLVLNLLRQETSLKTSLRQKRLRAGWDDAYLWKVLQNEPQE